MAVFSAVVIVANLELFNLHNSHSTVTYFFIFGSILVYFFVFLFFSAQRSNPLYRSLNRLLVTPNFYFFLFTVVYVCSIFVSSIYKIRRSRRSPRHDGQSALQKDRPRRRRAPQGFFLLQTQV